MRIKGFLCPFCKKFVSQEELLKQEKPEWVETGSVVVKYCPLNSKIIEVFEDSIEFSRTLHNCGASFSSMAADFAVAVVKTEKSIYEPVGDYWLENTELLKQINEEVNHEE